MTPARLLTTALLLALVSAQGWTQYVAYQYRYQAALGTPVWTLRAGRQVHPLYAPWQGLVWQWQWWSRTPFYMGAAGLSLILLACALSRGKRQTQPPAMEGHGSTVWATPKVIKQAKLYGRSGIVLARAGGWLRRLVGRDVLRFDGEENVLVVGPERSGKGLLYKRTLLDRRQGHALTVDIRGDTFKDTAGYAATFSRVLSLALTQPWPYCMKFTPGPCPRWPTSPASGVSRGLIPLPSWATSCGTRLRRPLPSWGRRY